MLICSVILPSVNFRALEKAMDSSNHRNTAKIAQLSNDGRSIAAEAGIELLHSIQDPVLIVTPQGEIIEVNTATLDAANKQRQQVIGAGVCAIIHGGRWPHIECPLEEFLRTCNGKSENTKLPGLGGEYHLTISPLADEQQNVYALLLRARRLTREESVNVETIRTAQLAAIGELAAGVAHEVNNPINGIINFAQLLLDDAGEGPLQTELLSRIVKEGERIATIIDSLLSFSRESGDQLEQIDFRDVITDCLALVNHQLTKDGISVETELSERPCPLIGNYLQLQQVIFNIINNSRFALNERHSGPSVDKQMKISCNPHETPNGRVIRVVIKDSGTGIPQGILDKLFEPFFTSKPRGQGTGLGLSISYGIINNHGGTLSVDSILNQFTDMIIEIPEYQKGTEEAPC